MTSRVTVVPMRARRSSSTEMGDVGRIDLELQDDDGSIDGPGRGIEGVKPCTS
jgi:hypothetical protein